MPRMVQEDVVQRRVAHPHGPHVSSESVDDRAHELVGPIIDAFGRDVRAVRVSHPTLHDVFLHHTGRRFE